MSMSLSKKTVVSTDASKGWKYGLWGVQVLLALAFGMAGLMKMGTPIIELARQLPWTASVPELMVRFIGFSEFAGALGLILPSAARIKPFLTPLAALCLMTIMFLASLFHISRGEFGNVPVNLIFGAIAAFVAYGRYKKAPIESK